MTTDEKHKPTGHRNDILQPKSDWDHKFYWTNQIKYDCMLLKGLKRSKNEGKLYLRVEAHKNKTLGDRAGNGRGRRRTKRVEEDERRESGKHLIGSDAG